MRENNTQLEDLDPLQIGSLAATWYGRHIGGYGEKCGKEFERLDSELQECVRAAVDRIDDNSTTGDMEDLAEDLVGHMVRLSQRPERRKRKRKKAKVRMVTMERVRKRMIVTPKKVMRW